MQVLAEGVAIQNNTTTQSSLQASAGNEAIQEHRSGLPPPVFTEVAPALTKVGDEFGAPHNDEDAFSSFEELVDWVSQQREGILHGHLFFDTHLIAFAPFSLTLRLSNKAPKDLPQQLELLLKKKKNEAWTIAISDEIGQPTLHEKEKKIQQDRQNVILQEPLVKMIVEAFPGTTLIDT